MKKDMKIFLNFKIWILNSTFGLMSCFGLFWKKKISSGLTPWLRRVVHLDHLVFIVMKIGSYGFFFQKNEKSQSFYAVIIKLLFIQIKLNFIY